MVTEVEHLFMYLSVTCASSLERELRTGTWEHTLEHQVDGAYEL